MLKTLGASVLVLALCIPALAGDMPCPPVAPPPPTTSAMQEPDTEGEIQFSPLVDIGLILLTLF